MSHTQHPNFCAKASLRTVQGWAKRVRPRLASSGMPLQPFVYTLSDLVRDAVPYDEASSGLAANSSEGSAGLSAILITGGDFPICKSICLTPAPKLVDFVRRPCFRKTPQGATSRADRSRRRLLTCRLSTQSLG